MKPRLLAVVGVFAAPVVTGAAIHFDNDLSPSPNSITVQDTLDCLDTLQASDSVDAIVKMTVKPQIPGTRLPADFEGLMAQEFRSRLRIPIGLPLSVVEGWEPCDTVAGTCEAGALMLGSQAYATAHNDGTLSRIGVIDVTLTPAFADSVGTILHRISEARLVPFFEKPDSILLDISIGVEQNVDSVPAFRHLFRAKLPRYKSQFAHAHLPKNPGGPKYPRIAEMQGVGDTVQVAFTVLPDGRVEPQTVDLLKGHYKEFIRAVLDKLATIRFVPARLSNCPVTSHIKQTFIFMVR